jgi:hypothetical protein
MMSEIKPRRVTGTLLSIQTPTPKYAKYDTWYDFKKELESLCGYPVLNTLWLQIKPQIALPWDKATIRSVLSKLKAS